MSFSHCHYLLVHRFWYHKHNRNILSHYFAFPVNTITSLSVITTLHIKRTTSTCIASTTASEPRIIYLNEKHKPFVSSNFTNFPLLGNIISWNLYVLYLSMPYLTPNAHLKTRYKWNHLSCACYTIHNKYTALSSYRNNAAYLGTQVTLFTRRQTTLVVKTTLHIPDRSPRENQVNWARH